MEAVSNTMKKLLKKYNCTLEEYRKKRRERVKALKRLQQDKHKAALAGRKSKDSKKGKK